MIRKIAKFVGGATIKLWTAFREGRLSLSPLWWFTALGLYWQELGVSGSNAPASPEPMDRLRTDRSYRQWLDSTSREGAGLGEAESRSGFLSIVALVQSASLVADVVESVRAQRFSNWGLWLIWSSAPDRRFDRSGDGLGTGPGNEQRGCVASVSLEEISGADGRWLPPGAGGAVVLLDTGTRLAPGALSQIARAVVESDADWIYTDDDLQTEFAKLIPLPPFRFRQCRVMLARQLALQAAGPRHRAYFRKYQARLIAGAGEVIANSTRYLYRYRLDTAARKWLQCD